MNIAFETLRAFLLRSGLKTGSFVLNLDRDNRLELFIFSKTGGWSVAMRPPTDFQHLNSPAIHFPASLQFNGHVTELAIKSLELLNRFMPEDRYREE